MHSYYIFIVHAIGLNLQFYDPWKDFLYDYQALNILYEL